MQFIPKCTSHEVKGVSSVLVAFLRCLLLRSVFLFVSYSTLRILSCRDLLASFEFVQTPSVKGAPGTFDLSVSKGTRTSQQ